MLRRAGEGSRSGAWVRYDAAWVPAIGAGVALGCAYFLAARLGLALVSDREDVALFWPASGVAAGALIVLGWRGRVCVVVGVFCATIAANLLGDRNLWASLSFGVCNVGEGLLAAWLVERWTSARPVKFDDVRALWGFLAAAATASATAATGATVAMHQFHVAASPADIWRVWAAADGLGIVMVAPLVVGLYHLRSEPAPRQETIEGTGALAVLAAASGAAYGAPAASSWLVPPAVLFPLLLWIAARCRPVFAAAAAFIICGALVISTTFHLGLFAHAAIPVLNVQVTMLVASLCALTLAALFAERRRNEAALRESNERLRLALGGAQLGVWSVDVATGAFESDERDSRINGYDPAAPPRTLAQARRYVHRDDLPHLDRAFAAAGRTSSTCQAEYRVLAGNARSPQVRWIAVEGTAVLNAEGHAVRLLGVTRDITERKRAEEQKNLLLAELDHRVKNALAVVAAIVSRTQVTSASVADFVAALHGRIKSMATTHELLSCRKWHGLSLTALIERELEPHATGGNVRVDGSDVLLRAEAGQALAMVVHELVTNAAKYGALSVEHGRVSVAWRHAPENASDAALVLDWEERDGPLVAPSSRVGYGTSVIRDLIPYELGGRVDFTLAPEGARCRLQLPAKWLSARDLPGSALNGSGAAAHEASARSTTPASAATTSR